MDKIVLSDLLAGNANFLGSASCEITTALAPFAGSEGAAYPAVFS